MTLRDIAVAFGYEVDQASVSKAEGTIKGISNMAKKFLGAIGIGFSIKGMSELAQAAADAEALESQFNQVFTGIEDKAAESLQTVADDAGAMVNRMKGSFTQLAAFTKTTGASEEEALAIAERGMRAAADSAAFYDRSIEDVTASLQSFLKGNYEQDAALGLSATETTRNAAAMDLYGKSFKDLTEYQKQLTLLKMVEDANNASGALGQAGRESETWTNQLGNLKQAFKDLKAAGGSGFLKPAIEVLKILTSLVQKATVKVKELTSENGAVTKATEKILAIVKRLQPVVTRMATGIARLVDKLGGLRNIIKLLTITIAAFAIVLNFAKGIAAFKKLVDVVKKFDKATFLARLKVLAIVAVIVILALLVEDFINFMKGNDSVIGEVFEKAGIDADKVRATISNAFNKIKEVATKVFGAIGDFFVKHKDQILGVIGAIGKVIAAIGAVIAIVKTVMAVFTAVKAVIAAVGAVIAFITSPVGLVIAAITALIAAGVLLYKNWETIKAGAVSMWKNIVSVFTSIGTAIADAISGAVKGAINKVLSKAASMINGFIRAINFAIGVINAIPGVSISKLEELEVPQLAEGGIATGATGAIVGEGSEPEAIMPLSKLGAMINKYVNLAKENDVGRILQTLSRAATASPATAYGSSESRTSSVVQNVEINNSYTGGSAETQRNVSKGMKKAAVDATTQMARALAYAKG